MINQDKENIIETAKQPLSKPRKLGISLVILSFILYGFILLVPFIPYSTSIKVTISSVLAILGEISFWVGGIILGKEVIARYKKYISPFSWFKKKS